MAAQEDRPRAEERVELVRGRHALLRLTEESDAERIVQWRNDPTTARWLNQWEPLSVEAHLRWHREARERGDFLIFFEGLDGEPIGCCSIFELDRPGTSGQWGRLFAARVGGGSSRMLESCYLLHRMCLEALGFHRLYGQVWKDNERAWRLYQFLGWVEEGCRREHDLAADGYHDVLVISVFPREFAAQRGAIESKLYGSDAPPEITDEQAQRLRSVVGSCIHRRLEAPESGRS